MPCRASFAPSFRRSGAIAVGWIDNAASLRKHPAPRMRFHPAWAVTPLAVVAFMNVAAAADAPLAVLGIEASEAPDSLATSLSDALRQRVSASKGFRLVPGRDLVEVKLVFSCPDEAPSCMAQAGKSLGASKLIFGSVKKSVGDSYLVTLKLLDTNRAVVDAFVAEQITKG